MDLRSGYLQTVAGFFLGLRGAPFFLSPKEIQALNCWESDGIPLSVVLDAIQAFFDRDRMRKGRRKGVRITHCQAEVRRFYVSFKERRVGRGDGLTHRRDKGSRIRTAVDTFLQDVPDEWSELRPFFEEARIIVQADELDEEKLESLDTSVEDMLVRKAPSDIAGTIEHQVLCLGLADREEQRILRLRLIKYLRSQIKIPYLSPFYY